VNLKTGADVISELGLELKHSPTTTELRLPSRLGLVPGAVLGCAGMIIVVMGAGIAAAACFGPRERLGYVALAALFVMALAYGLMQAVRVYRYGVKLSVTPDRLIAKRHWATGEPSLELYLSQVKLDETPRAIVISKGRRKLKMGTSLKAEERHAVVEFLRDVIDGHTQATASAVAAADVREAESSPAERAHSGQPDACATRPTSAEPRDQNVWGPDVLALCRRLQEFDLDDVHFAPNIPEPVVAAAVQSYLNLHDDQVLLAIVGVKKQGSPNFGCALTTERIYWPTRTRRPVDGTPLRCQWLDYAALPDQIKPRGLGSTIDLGQGQLLSLQGNQPLRDALINFLVAVRALARGEGARFGASESQRAIADAAWPQVAAAKMQTLALQTEIRAFEGRTRVAARAVVTLAIAFACFAIFVAIVAAGVPPLTPSGEQLFEWGANFGPSVVFDHQFWRLFTAMFLHIGLFHLAMNMYCLITAGPVVERFFGHIGFALLYILSGTGGFIASLWAHPIGMSAGASGAIFGIFGGLLGFLTVRHRDFPLTVLRPVRNGAIAFVGYNTFFSLSVPGIDMAAHLGGLLTGFVCGLLMSLGSQTQPQGSLRSAPALRRIAVAAVLSIALAGLGRHVIDRARAGILADPEMGPLIESQMSAAPAFNEFFGAAQPLLLELDRIAQQMDTINVDLGRGRVSPEGIAQTLDRLKHEARSLETRIAAVPARNKELQEIRSHIAAAQSKLAAMLNSIDHFVTSKDQSQFRGPVGFNESADAYIKEGKQIGGLRDAYIKAHGLTFVPAKSEP
jgi:rhomboid protease GluP